MRSSSGESDLVATLGHARVPGAHRAAPSPGPAGPRRRSAASSTAVAGAPAGRARHQALTTSRRVTGRCRSPRAPATAAPVPPSPSAANGDGARRGAAVEDGLQPPRPETDGPGAPAPLRRQVVGPCEKVPLGAGGEGRHRHGPAAAQPALGQVGGDVGRPPGELPARLGGDPGDVGPPPVGAVPGHPQPAGELVAQVAVVEGVGGRGVGVDAPAVQGAPAALGPPAQIGHHDVGVEMGIERPCSPGGRNRRRPPRRLGWARARGRPGPPAHGQRVTLDIDRRPPRRRRRAPAATASVTSGSPSPWSRLTDFGAEKVRSNPATVTRPRAVPSTSPVAGSSPARTASRSAATTTPERPESRRPLAHPPSGGLDPRARPVGHLQVVGPTAGSDLRHRQHPDDHGGAT